MAHVLGSVQSPVELVEDRIEIGLSDCFSCYCYEFQDVSGLADHVHLRHQLVCKLESYVHLAHAWLWIEKLCLSAYLRQLSKVGICDESKERNLSQSSRIIVKEVDEHILIEYNTQKCSMSRLAVNFSSSKVCESIGLTFFLVLCPDWTKPDTNFSYSTYKLQ